MSLGAVIAWLVGVQAARAQAPGGSPELRVQNMFDPLSAPAQAIHEVSLLVLAICAGIFLVVTGLLVYIVVKYRRRGPEDDSHEPAQVYGSTQIELAWTVIPILITVVLILVTARTVGEIQNRELPKDALEIRIVGHQWWWEVHYPQLGIITANEIHVPVSAKEKPRPVRLVLQSADVIHSFWVPQLNGKTDVIPNRENRTWIQPWKVGTYFGNCAEYCGSQHANMLIRVFVEGDGEFGAWVRSQQSEPATDPHVSGGRRLFHDTSCVNCHRVGGPFKEGVYFGPDLTHLMSRQWIASGMYANDERHLRDWVQDPQLLKPRCLMPDMQLTAEQVDGIVAYLMTLK